jgi:glycerate 2-kinase
VSPHDAPAGAAPPAVRAALAALFSAALATLEPARLVGRVLRRRAGAVVLAEPGRGGRPLVLAADARRGRASRSTAAPGVLVVGAGKGAAGLAAAVEATLGPSVVGGVVIVPAGCERALARIALAIGGHPVPDRRSVAATARLITTIARAPGVPVLVLLTGGASSLLVAPAEGLTLADKRRTNALLLASGARIDEMNAVRKHLSAVKGGRLAERLAGRRAAALVVSDVPGDDPSVIASGPTVADPTTYADARRILAAYGLEGRVPARVLGHLERGIAGAVAETPKPGAPTLARVRTFVLASNATARASVVAAARSLGYRIVVNVRRPLTGATAPAARAFAARIRRCQARLGGPLPALLVAGGETTVRIGSRAGQGGRNQEFALEVARMLAGRPGWALLSAGTDGIDGPTDAAGAFADGSTLARAARAGRPVAGALARHDVFPLLGALGDLYRTGPTGTNVADLKLALVWKERGWRLPRAV